MPAYLAPAKLNLSLRIIGRRNDGYHLLQSIFCLTDLCDTLHINPRDDGQIHLANPTENLPPERDLCHRAARLLQQHTGTTQGADIRLEKRIPTGAGMGGGSSDAATVLAALNQLWDCRLDRATLMQLGLQLGADVPFFLFGQNAFVEGIGEQIQSLDIPKQHFLIVKPNVHISTAHIFNHPQLTRNSPIAHTINYTALHPLQNDIQDLVLREYPQVAAAHRLLCEHGQARLTGTGACLFLSLPDADTARAIASRLPEGLEHHIAQSLSHHPLSDILPA